MMILIEKAMVYGCLGILIEHFFTGIGSIIRKDWSAKTTSYIWMLPIYGFTALALEGISEALPWPFYLKAFVYVPIIYGVEGLSGWTIKRLIGSIPWDYKHSAWTPAGLVNFSYSPFWFLLALSFDFLAHQISKLALFIVTQL